MPRTHRLVTDVAVASTAFAIKRPALGIATDSCVLATAQDAKMRGLPFRVPIDATAAVSPARKEAALAVIRLGMLADTRGVTRVLGRL